MVPLAWRVSSREVILREQGVLGRYVFPISSSFVPSDLHLHEIYWEGFAFRFPRAVALVVFRNLHLRIASHPVDLGSPRKHNINTNEQSSPHAIGIVLRDVLLSNLKMAYLIGLRLERQVCRVVAPAPYVSIKLPNISGDTSYNIESEYPFTRSKLSPRSPLS